MGSVKTQTGEVCFLSEESAVAVLEKSKKSFGVAEIEIFFSVMLKQK